MRRHRRFGCPHRLQWREFRRLLRYEANTHRQATTVSRVFLLLEISLQTHLSTLTIHDNFDVPTGALHQHFDEPDDSDGAGSPMDTSTPPNSSVGAAGASPVADATTGVANLDV
ncbi:hypothetical protein RhiJN_07782 [Ceratobasidium sp. AG-Ba]|nr:hypothetical protein RhiJN_07782 [Ceratobasidium sp. AG-Ba]